jgi:hypothetical protein
LIKTEGEKADTPPKNQKDPAYTPLHARRAETFDEWVGAKKKRVGGRVAINKRHALSLVCDQTSQPWPLPTLSTMQPTTPLPTIYPLIDTYLDTVFDHEIISGHGCQDATPCFPRFRPVSVTA